mmetsp:Transcript_66179/g.194105  ORF Transcript_66179/g.194105 Transcript_66179/m.194105 type:complete len:248 (-) Transcript_66179:35-778(-)
MVSVSSQAAAKNVARALLDFCIFAVSWTVSPTKARTERSLVQYLAKAERTSVAGFALSVCSHDHRGFPSTCMPCRSRVKSGESWYGSTHAMTSSTFQRCTWCRARSPSMHSCAARVCMCGESRSSIFRISASSRPFSSRVSVARSRVPPSKRGANAASSGSSAETSARPWSARALKASWSCRLACSGVKRSEGALERSVPGLSGMVCSLRMAAAWRCSSDIPSKCSGPPMERRKGRAYTLWREPVTR